MESEASPDDVPTCPLVSRMKQRDNLIMTHVSSSLQTSDQAFTQSATTKERPNLSLNLKSISLRLDCQTSTPGPSTAAILKKIENVEPDLKEIFPHIQESHPQNVLETLDSHLHTPETTAAPESSMENLFDECFKNASTRRLHLTVPTSAINKDQSLETPALNIISPIKGPNLLTQRPPNPQPSSVNHVHSDINDEKDVNSPPRRKRGRPPKAATEQLTNEANCSMNDNESKKSRDKERNRLAAINYRRNQKDWVREISARVRLLEDKNATLEAQLVTAQKKIVRLENQLLQMVKPSGPKLIYKCLMPSVIVSGQNDQSKATQQITQCPQNLEIKNAISILIVIINVSSDHHDWCHYECLLLRYRSMSAVLSSLCLCHHSRFCTTIMAHGLCGFVCVLFTSLQCYGLRTGICSFRW